MPTIFVTSYYNVQDLASGGKRRVRELMRACGPGGLLMQPRPPVKALGNISFPVDFGKKKYGINWGIFNCYWPANRRAVRRAIDAAAPDVCIGTSIWSCDVFAHCSGPRVLDAQNVDALAIEERFGARHPFTRLVRRQEARVLRRMDRVFCCSDVDAEQFRNRYGVAEEKLAVIPNGVHMPDPAVRDTAAEALRESMGSSTILFFMGKLDYAPNREGLQFLNSLMQRLESVRPGAFRAVVTGGPAWPSNIPRAPAVHYGGRVRDIAPWIRMADLCVAPIFSGSGTRIKVLEYLAAEKPVIATAKALEGIEAVPGRDVERAETVAETVDAVLAMTDAPERASERARHGAALVRKYYAWDRSVDRWRHEIASLCRRGAPAPAPER